MSAADVPLEVEGLYKRFGGLTAVKDVSFSIKAGEILGLIGPNGSGKSTVMKSILGVERPDGRVGARQRRRGRGLAAAQDRAARRRDGVPTFASAASADGSREHRPRAPARQVAGFPSRRRRRAARARDRRARRAGRGARSAALDPALRRPAQDGDRQSHRPQSQSGAGRRTLRRPDGARNGGVRQADRRNARRRPSGAGRRSQRQERLRARRSHLRHVRRRAHRRGLGAGGHAERNGAPGLSRRRPGDGGASRIRVSRRPDALPRSPGSERLLRQGASAGERVDPRPSGRIRFDRRAERGGQDDAVQRDLGPCALFGRNPSAGPIPARQERRLDRARAASCNRRKGASSSPR